MFFKQIVLGSSLALALSGVAVADGWKWGHFKSKPGSVPTRLVHGIDGTDLGLNQALPVDIRIGHRCIARKVPFGTIAEGPKLKPGTHRVRVSLASNRKGCRGTLVLSQTIDVNFGDNLSLVAHQTDDGGIRLSKFTNDVRDAGVGNARVTVRHTADAPAVDILVEGGVAIPGLANPQSSKLDVPANTYNVQIAPAGGAPLDAGVDLPLPEGANTIVYAVGSLNSGSFDLLVDQLPLN